MIVVASKLHKQHQPLELTRGKLVRSTESSQRADIIADALRSHNHTFIEPDTVEEDLLSQIHTPEYIRFLSTAWERWTEIYGSDSPAMAFTWPARSERVVRPSDLVGQLGYHSFSADSSIVAGTWSAVSTAAAIAMTATDHVVAGASAAYALCRPPGHHATADQFGGYCFINNSAVAAQRFLNSGHKRVAVLDIDYHHGNGTQSIFYQRDDVLTLSIHADPAEEFPWYSGYSNETGEGSGDGCNFNLPLPRGTNLADWHSALDTALDRIQVSGTDALVVALGVDTYRHDPLGTFALDTGDYTETAQRIQSLGIPMVIVQEGGYAADALGENVAAFLKPFGQN